MVAGGEVGHLVADRLDDPGGLVPEDGRERVRIQALHEVQVRMTDARRDGMHEHLVGTYGIDLYLIDDELTRG